MRKAIRRMKQTRKRIYDCKEGRSTWEISAEALKWLQSRTRHIGIPLFQNLLFQTPFSYSYIAGRRRPQAGRPAALPLRTDSFVGKLHQ